jgi:chorismate mutase
METKIGKCRGRIAKLDSDLLLLLNRRAELVARLGVLNQEAGLPVSDRGREREMLIRLVLQNTGPFDNRAVIRVFLRILRECRRFQG